MHIPHPTSLPTTVPGQSLQGWSVSGTALWYPGQQGERMARDEAEKLNKEKHEQENNGGSEAPEGVGGGALRKHCVDRVPEAGVELSGQILGRNDSPDSDYPAPNEQAPAPEPSQAELAALYRARIKFHKNAGKDTTQRIAAAAKDVPGYVPVKVEKKIRVK
jgi:hypothetical protein